MVFISEIACFSRQLGSSKKTRQANVPCFGRHPAASSPLLPSSQVSFLFPQLTLPPIPPHRRKLRRYQSFIFQASASNLSVSAPTSPTQEGRGDLYLFDIVKGCHLFPNFSPISLVALTSVLQLCTQSSWGFLQCFGSRELSLFFLPSVFFPSQAAIFNQTWCCVAPAASSLLVTDLRCFAGTTLAKMAHGMASTFILSEVASPGASSRRLREPLSALLPPPRSTFLSFLHYSLCPHWHRLASFPL